MTCVSRAVWRLVLRLAFAVAAALVLWLLGPLIWHLLSPFLLALPVAAALQKPIRLAEKRLRLKHGISVAVWVVLVCAVICVLLYWILATVIGQILQLSGNYQQIISDVINLLRNASAQLLDALDYFPDGVEAWARVALNDAFAALSATATRWAGDIINFTIGVASSIPYGLIYLNFLLLGIFFISADYGKIRTRVLGLMGDSARSRSKILSGSAGHGLAGYVKVQLLYGLLVFAVSWPCLSLFGLPYPALIAFAAAMLEFLPIFGNGTLYIPWAVVCYLISMPALGTQMLVLHLALYIFRRMTEPKLLSNQIGISTLLSLVAMFAGMQLGGVFGLILAPVVAVVVQSAWQGGLFAATIQDVRMIVGHVRGVLTDPPVDEPE